MRSTRGRRRLEVAQVAERLRQPPVRVHRRDRLAVDLRDDLEGGQRRRAVERPRTTLARRSRDERAVGVDVRLHVGERAAVAGQAQPRVERLDDVERVQELAGRVGRVAEVVVERDAAEQVVAGDEQAALGLEQADVRRRVAGRLVDLPGAEVGLDLDAGQRSRSGSTMPAMPIALAAARLAVARAAAPRARRSGARPRCGARAPRRGPCAARVMCSWLGCIHSSQPGALDDRRRPGRSGRSARACRRAAARARGAG